MSHKEHRGGKINIELHGMHRDGINLEAFRRADPAGSLRLCAIGVRRIGPIKTSEEDGIGRKDGMASGEKIKLIAPRTVRWGSPGLRGDGVRRRDRVGRSDLSRIVSLTLTLRHPHPGPLPPSGRGRIVVSESVMAAEFMVSMCESFFWGFSRSCAGRGDGIRRDRLHVPLMGCARPGVGPPKTIDKMLFARPF
jgi:hypothetical protein